MKESAKGRFFENTLELYVFENFGRETKKLFEKSEMNFEKSVGTQIYMAKLTLIYIVPTNTTNTWIVNLLSNYP